MYRLLIAATILSLSTNLIGQDIRISGTLTDELTNEPLAFAHVGIEGTSVGTVTNSIGQFSVLIPDHKKNGTLSFSYLGYSSFSVLISEIKGPVDLNISLKPQSIYLPDLMVKVNKKSLIEEAIERIPENHDQGDMRLSGFWRAQIQDSEQHIQLSETAFDIFRVDEKDAMKIMKARACRDSAAYSRFTQFNAGIRPQGLFKTSFLNDLGLFSKKTLKRHDFELVDATVYNDRPVLVVKFDRKESNEDNGYKGKILLDAETLAFIKINLSLSLASEEKPLLFGSRLLAKITGLGNSTWEKNESEYNYRMVDGKWYLSHAFFNAKWNLVDNDKTFEEPITYRGDFVVTNISKENITLPPKDERADKNILVKQSETGSDDFWLEFNYLVPDQDFDKIFREVEEKNKSYKPVE